jgi:UDP-N-acetylmuramoyl-tripeptide--D-alanyl-D-alanine ligase
MSGGQVENFVKAATVAKILGFSDTTIGERVLRWKPGEMRGETVNFRGHNVYLDCYNANPAAMLDALQFFEQKYSGANTYILGGMGELGEFSEACHGLVAACFYGRHDVIIFAIGTEMRVLFERLRAKGNEVYYFEETEQARGLFQKKLRGNIFIKGSQCYRLWELIEDGDEK